MFRALQDYDELYATPDGEELLKKTWIAAKLAGTVAFGAATLDVFCLSHPKTVLHTLARYAYYGFPLIGISSAYIVTTGISGSIRQKDDKLNSALGGVVAGCLYGVWRKSRPVGALACVLFATSAILKKHASQMGWTLLDFDNYKVQPGGVRSVRYDWSLIEERPHNWTTGNEATK